MCLLLVIQRELNFFGEVLFANVMNHKMDDIANFETFQHLALLNKSCYLIEAILIGQWKLLVSLFVEILDLKEMNDVALEPSILYNEGAIDVWD